MKYMDFVNSRFYHFRIKSAKLCDLLRDTFGFYVDDDENMLVSEWLIKADAYIGEDEQNVVFKSRVQCYEPLQEFDVITYLIELFSAHAQVGLSTFEYWREALRFYSLEETTNFSPEPLYEELIDSDELSRIIDELKTYHKEYAESIEGAIFFEYTLDGDYESELYVLTVCDNGAIVMESYEEADINDWTGCINFAEDVIIYEFELDHLTEPICEEFGFE